MKYRVQPYGDDGSKPHYRLFNSIEEAEWYMEEVQYFSNKYEQYNILDGAGEIIKTYTFRG